MTCRSRKPDERGFALIATVVVVLFLLAIAAVVILPPILDGLTTTTAASTASELQTLHRAIIGDQATTFGYFGDVGAYPNSLMDLVRDPTGSTAGWKGPYLRVPSGSILSDQLVDAYGNPFEYYLDIAQNDLDRIAIISRGPDGQSSESLSASPPANPNTQSTFAGMKPTDNTYLAQTGNADNATFPNLNSSNNDALLKRSVLGTFQPAIRNFDFNAAVNFYVAACPNLYTMTLTSVSRGSADVRTEMVGQVDTALTPVDLQQGAWTATITSPLSATALYSQTVTILPNATAAQTINFAPGLNSVGTATFTMAIRNQSALSTNDLDVYISGVKSATTATHGATINFTVPGCAPIQLKLKGTTTVVDGYTMPYGISTFTRTEFPSAGGPFQVTIVNQTTRPEVRVYQNGNNTVLGVEIGQVAMKKQKTFTVTGGDFITVKNNAGTTVFGPTAITATTSQSF